MIQRRVLYTAQLVKKFCQRKDILVIFRSNCIGYPSENDALSQEYSSDFRPFDNIQLTTVIELRK